MAKTARELLAPTSAGGLGQGSIVLTRITPGVVDPAEPWKPVPPTTVTQTLRGAVSGISREMIGTEAGGTVLLASDRQVITEVPTIDYQPGDTLTIDGVPVHILLVRKIPAAGITSAVKFVVRG